MMDRSYIAAAGQWRKMKAKGKAQEKAKPKKKAKERMMVANKAELRASPKK